MPSFLSPITTPISLRSSPSLPGEGRCRPRSWPRNRCTGLPGPYTLHPPPFLRWRFCFNSSELVTKPHSHEYINNGWGGGGSVLKKFPQGLASKHFCCIIFNCLQTSAGKMRRGCKDSIALPRLGPGETCWGGGVGRVKRREKLSAIRGQEDGEGSGKCKTATPGFLRAQNPPPAHPRLWDKAPATSEAPLRASARPSPACAHFP